MQCRSLSIEMLKAGHTEGERIFSNFVLKYPDFIEFDDLNEKIVTRHAIQGCFRVWSMIDYSLLYVLNEPKLEEFKIW